MQGDLNMSLKKATFPAIYFLKHAFNGSFSLTFSIKQKCTVMIALTVTVFC